MKAKPFLTLVLSLFAVTLAGQAVHANPIISELMAGNLDTLEDEDDDASDWIEFYNPTDTSLNLSGHFLTDDRRNLRKWKFPGNLQIAGGGYGLIFASGKDRGSLFASAFHTNFELSSGGDYLALIAPDGETILSEFADRYPPQRDRFSFGIGNNEAGGSDWRYFETPTPRAANGEGIPELPPVVADTKFSLGRGFYEEPITVEITTATEGATIYYSTDGSDPGPGSVFLPGKKYTGPLTIEQTKLLRARAFKDGLEPTNIDTNTYLFIEDVLGQSDEQPGLPDRWNGQAANYGINQTIVESPLYRDEIREAFLALPTLSIVTDEDNLWASDGLYLNTTRTSPDGAGAEFEYEFEVSAELLNPDGSAGFQIQAGLRAQGGASRNADRSPKHALSLRFRRIYGDGRLNYPILKSSPQQSYDAIHLRARYNNSWIHSNGDQRSRAQYIRDQWARDSMIEMGTPSAGHGDYHHLYLNGLYWGIYVFQERMDAAHYADYYGGLKSDLDAINGGRATNGDLRSYNAMRDAARDQDWDAIQRRLDVDNYIDLHTIQRFGSNQDWKNDGNWKAAGGGRHDRPWQYYAWDTERILESVTASGTGPSQDPTTIFNSLEDIPEFLQRFGDRLHKHLFNGGALTPERNIARYEKRAQQLNLAIIAESARWGDHRRNNPYERDDEWMTERRRIVEDCFPRRTEEMIAQFQDAGLYPKTLGVDLNQFGGRVPSDFALELSSQGTSVFNPGKFYFTTDGSDPRGPDGEIGPTTTEYTAPIILTQSVPFQARVRSSRGEWSALTETFFSVSTTPASAENLTISELMYHPGPPTADESAAGHVSSDDFEFIELENVGNQPVDLAGASFGDGVRFTFQPGPLSVLEPGAFAVIVVDPEAYRFRYGPEAPTFNGVFEGSLDNGGESLRFLAEDGSVIQAFDYSDSGSWPETANGSGFSLVLQATDPDRGDSWQASVDRGGSPGASNPTAGFEVVINEILSNSAPPAVDAIELFNPGQSAVDVSGWFLTDDASLPKQYALSSGSIIPPSGYLVVFEDNDSDPTNNDTLPLEFFGQAFGLSSRGDSVHLFSADAQGNLTGYDDGFSFGAAEEGVTFGRHVDSQGRVEYPPQSVSTLGAANALPAVGDVVISEIMHHSPHAQEDGEDPGEYLEIFNRSAATLTLAQWEIEGLRYIFPEGTQLAPGAVLVVARSAPAVFSDLYSAPARVAVLGPFEGRLDNDGERLTLTRPGETYLDGDEEKTTQVRVDSVRYNDAEPWPESADGLGHSLERLALNDYADEVTHWGASADTGGTPGVVDAGSEPNPGGLTFEQWQSLIFTADQLGDEAISGILADPDSDGLINRVEFVLGTAPLEISPTPVSLTRSGDTLSLVHDRRKALAEGTVEVEASADLNQWTEVSGITREVSASPAHETLERVTLTLTPDLTVKDAPARYLRLKIN